MSSQRKIRIGVLGSGKGSNLVAIAEACASGQIPVEIALVISDVAEAGILSHAREHDVPARYMAPGAFRTKLEPSVECAYCEALREAGVEWVALAGFMRVLKQEFLETFPQQIINIHPSLLPAFPGIAAWKQALDYGVKFTGCTVHFVDQGVDSGPIIAQQVVPVLEQDTPTSLHERIQKAERTLYPNVIGALAQGHITVENRRTFWLKLVGHA